MKDHSSSNTPSTASNTLSSLSQTHNSTSLTKVTHLIKVDMSLIPASQLEPTAEESARQKLISTFPVHDEVRRICLPTYQKKKDFVWFVNVLRYVGYCKQVDYLNQFGEVINRTTMEAAWESLLNQRYARWDTSAMVARRSDWEVEEYREEATNKAMLQVYLIVSDFTSFALPAGC
jgi:hypothetical protein